MATANNCARSQSAPSARFVEDAEFLAGLRSGDAGAFDRLYEDYFQRLYNFSYLRLRNHADSEEVVQETFTAVFRCIDSYTGRSTLSSWMYGIAKNKINNHIRRNRTEEARIERVETEGLGPTESLATGTPEEQAMLRSYVDVIGERLSSVARWQVEVFELRHLHNLSIPEISERTSRSSDAIRSSLYRTKRLWIEFSDVGGPIGRLDSEHAWG